MSIIDTIKKKLVGDIFPIFIIGAIFGLLGWMYASKFPIGIIETIAFIGLGFGAAELERKIRTKKTVSQEFWKWVCETKEDSTSKYTHCPKCGCGIGFPNRQKGMAFSIIFIITLIIIFFGHLMWK